MELKDAVKRLSALAQDSRLAVFRALIQAGPGGLAAGDIARRLQITPNTLSSQLNILSNAGLIVGRRDGRSIIYVADYDGMSALLVYLMEDCCEGRPEI
jgi:DNA-binding transcriptional ArsR family regulator